MLWTYLSRNNNFTNTSNLIPNILNFESVLIKNDENYENEINLLKNSYSNLIKEGFFDGFIRDYDTLFVSEYSPELVPIKKEKLIVLNLK